MKIICIGRNYIEHAKELKNPVPKEPVFFLKPDTSLLTNSDTLTDPIQICQLREAESSLFPLYRNLSIGV